MGTKIQEDVSPKKGWTLKVRITFCVHIVFMLK